MSNFTQALKELTGFDGERETVDTVDNQNTEKRQTVAHDVKFSFDDSMANVVSEEEIEIGDFDLRSAATEITPSMVISGNIKTDDDILLEGYIIGDVQTSGNFKTSGTQIGKLKAKNAAFVGAKQKGAVALSNDCVIESDSAVVGSIKCNNIKVDSKVKGNIDAQGIIALYDNAMVVGNLSGEAFNTSPTAKINGSIVLRALIQDFDIDVDFDIDMGGDF